MITDFNSARAQQLADQIDRMKGPRPAGELRALPLDPDAEAALQQVVDAAVQDERERIAGALDSEAELIPCAEDSAVIRRCAQLVRADFSYDAAEALEALETLKRPEASHE